MTDLKCDSARLWMQDASELHPLDGRRLDRHLATCAPCSAYRREQIDTNHLIDDALASIVGERSVRKETIARLSDVHVKARPGAADSVRKRSQRSVAVWAGAALAAAAIALAAYLPQIGSRIGTVATPAGAAWRVVRPDIAFPMTIDPSDSQHLLAGAMGQVYESRNAGTSWRSLGALPPGLAVRDLAVDAANPRHYLVATNHSVFVSGDSGLHWSVAARFVPGAMNMFLMQRPRSPSIWYLGPSVLWASFDDGRTWNRTAGTKVFAPYGIETLAQAPNGDLYTGIWGGGVAVSHDGGGSWERRSRGLNPHVVDLALRNGRLWAATSTGVFESQDTGFHWRLSGPAPHFFTTAIVDAGRYQMVGGNGGIFRSDDMGRSWHVATRGLPFYSYIYALIADPRHPNRVYACLNTDGIFRSDDAGRSWTRMDAGLPLSGGQYAPRSVLFRRQGVLWITDKTGADPQDLTVDSGVSAAVTSPDGAAVAYTTRVPGGWAARIVSAGGGSAATTIANGAGPPPRHILWSMGSSALAISDGGTVWVWAKDRPAGTARWSIPGQERLVGWSAGGKSILSWRRNAALVESLDPYSGQVMRVRFRSFPTPPLLAPDGMHIGLIKGDRLEIGRWGLVRTVATLAPGCTIRSWSAASSRVLVACSGYVEERASNGAILVHADLPRNSFWPPDSNSDLLFFRHGLRRWSAGNHRVLIVPGAGSAQPEF